MKRRKLLLSVVLAPFISSQVVAQQRAQLLLVRSIKDGIACGNHKAVPGKLYGVDRSVPLSSISDVSLSLNSGSFTWLSDTEELPYEDNVSNRSSIPQNTYKGFVRIDETKSWMQGKPNRAWRIELVGTGHRTNIQFHYGKNFRWSQGCIILAGNREKLVCSEQNSPEAAVVRVRDFVESQINSSEDTIVVKII